MIVTLRHSIEVASVQKATALREKLAAVLEGEEDVALVATDQARETRTFTVYGVNVEKREAFTEHVEATTEDEAQEKVAGRDIVITYVGVVGPAGIPTAEVAAP